MRSRQHDGRVHLVEKRTTLSEEFLPDRVLEGIAASLGARVQARIGPDVTYLIRLTGLSLPEADDFGVLFARWQCCGERIEPLMDRPTGFGAVVTKLVDIAGRCSGSTTLWCHAAIAWRTERLPGGTLDRHPSCGSGARAAGETHIAPAEAPAVRTRRLINAHIIKLERTVSKSRGSRSIPSLGIPEFQCLPEFADLNFWTGNTNS